MCGSCENCLISFHQMACVYAPPVTRPKFGYRWAAGGLKPKPRLGQKKILKYIPCLGQHPQFITLFMKKDKMHAVLF